MVVVNPPAPTPPAGDVGGGRLGVELGQNRADALDKEAVRLQELSKQLEQQHQKIVAELYTRLQSMDLSQEELKAILSSVQGQADDFRKTADAIDGSADALDSQSDLLNSYIDFSDQQADATASQLDSLKDTDNDDDDDSDDTDDTDDADDADDDNEEQEEAAKASIAQLEELLDDIKDEAAELQALVDDIEENIGGRADSFPAQLLVLLAAVVAGALIVLA